VRASLLLEAKRIIIKLFKRKGGCVSDSIQATVNSSLAIKNWMMHQEKDNLLLQKVLQGQEDMIMGLLASAISAQPVTGPQPLASAGAIGTKVHVTA